VTVHRVDMRRAAALGTVLAAGILVVLLGTHATPGGYHASTRYVKPYLGPKAANPSRSRRRMRFSMRTTTLATRS
jgi:hypothetical protein